MAQARDIIPLVVNMYKNYKALTKKIQIHPQELRYKNIEKNLEVRYHHQILLKEAITPQAMLATKQYIQHIQYNDTHVHIYFLMSVPRGLCHIIMLFLLTTHQLLTRPYSMIYGNITLIISPYIHII